MLLRPIVLYWIGGMVASSLGFIFTLLANRTLSIEEMGTLAFFVQLVTIASIGSVAIGITANAQMAGKKKQNIVSSGYRLFGWSLIVGAGLTMLYVLSAPWWQREFQISLSWLSILLSSLLFVIMYLLAWYRGLMNAKQLFVLSALVLMIEAAIKIFLAYIFYIRGDSVNVFLLSLPGSALVALLLSVYISRDYMSSLNLSLSLDPRTWSLLSQSILSRIGMVLLLSADIILAKFYLDPHDAGVYAVLSIVGKIIYFVTQSIYTLLTPLIAPSLHDAKKRRKKMVGVMGLCFFVCMLMVGVFNLLPKMSLGLLLGDRYLLILPYVLRYSVAISILSLVFLGTLYQVLRGKYLFTLLVFVCLLGEVILVGFMHNDVGQIVDIVLGVSVLVFVMQVFMSFSSVRMHRL